MDKGWGYLPHQYDLWDVYEDLEEWSRDELLGEIQRLHNDIASDLLTPEEYHKALDTVEGELLRRTSTDSDEDAYDRAMRGI